MVAARQTFYLKSMERQFSGFHVIEQRNLFFECVQYLLQQRIFSLHYHRHIFSSVLLPSHFNRTSHKTLLLLSSIEPTHEKTRSLCLLPSCGTTHIEKDVRILTKELFDDADESLGNLFITGRCLVIKICQIQPIHRKIRIRVNIEVYRVLHAIVCSKIQYAPLAGHKIGSPFINERGFKWRHLLYPFEIVISRLRKFFASLLSCLPLGVNPLFPCFLALPGSIKPGEDFLTGANFGGCCFHLPFFWFHAAKVRENCE